MEEDISILKWLVGSIILCLVFVIIGNFSNDKNIQVKAKGISEISSSRTTNIREPLLSPIEQQIKDVFGQYYPKAILLLKGKGSNTCAENRELDPNKVFDDAAVGGIGKDYGVFQINDKWQGVSNIKFLKDPAINIRMAWRIFEDDGYSFKLWTCGRYYGI